MKKYIMIGICIVLLAALLTGCGSKGQVENVSRPDFSQQTTENTEEVTVPPTLPVEIFVPEYEPDREELPTHEKAEQIIKGMTLNQVCRIMGNPQRNLEDSGMCPQWDINNGEKLTVRCEKDVSGSWYATYAEIEYPAPSMTEAEAKQIAEDLIVRFQWFRAVGVCCDFTATYDDLTGYLSPEQLEYYYGFQYRLDCCGTIEEVHGHIHHVINPDLVQYYPDDYLVTDDAGKLNLLVIPMGATFYHDVVLDSYDHHQIVATAQMMDEDGAYGTTTFVMERQADGFRIESFKPEIW